MGEGAASTVVDEPAGGDSTVNGEGENNKDSESSKGVTEEIAIEALLLACSHGSAQSVKLLLLQWGQDPLPTGYHLLHDAAEFDHAEPAININNNNLETSSHHNGEFYASLTTNTLLSSYILIHFHRSRCFIATDFPLDFSLSHICSTYWHLPLSLRHRRYGIKRGEVGNRERVIPSSPTIFPPPS